MKILIAPDKFKNSLASYDVADAIEEGIKPIYPNAKCFKLPIADGGEGTVETLVQSMNGEIINLEVCNPLFNQVVASYGIVDRGETAIIEMAKASGLSLISPSQYNPMKTTTYGTGELIKDAINRGCRKFIVGIGGSATNDAGIGMMRALGVRFYDTQGKELKGVGADLSKIAKIDMTRLTPEVKSSKFLIACDVTNPFYGKNGAAYIYAPQKGATPSMVEELDKGLKHFSKILKEQLKVDVAKVAGAGAAGGLGGGFLAFLDAKLQPGIDIVLEKINFKEYLKEVDLLITGEGRLDTQTIMGKGSIGVAKLAKKNGVKVIAIAGAIEQEAIDKLHKKGIDALFSIINQPMSSEEALNPNLAKALIRQEIEEIFRLFFLGQMYIKK